MKLTDGFWLYSHKLESVITGKIAYLNKILTVSQNHSSFLLGSSDILYFKSVAILCLLLILLSSCKFGQLDGSKLPDGFENVSHHGNSYFVYIEKDHQGDKVQQLAVGRKLCQDTYEKSNYCEVYYFADKKDIPKEFPIVNRISPIGMYEMKYGSRKLKMLSGEQSNSGSVLFYKDYWKGNNILRSVKDKK